MKDIQVTIKTTVNGEEKEQELTLSVPENLTEATREWSKEDVYKLALRMHILDKTNAARVILRGGEAKAKRKESNDLAKQILADPDLLARVKDLVG